MLSLCFLTVNKARDLRGHSVGDARCFSIEFGKYGSAAACGCEEICGLIYRSGIIASMLLVLICIFD